MTWLICPMNSYYNDQVKQLIVETLYEFGCIGPGYASNDQEINDMNEAYPGSEAQYWVLLNPETKMVMGGIGFSRLKGTAVQEGICELQKFYFHPNARGRGWGKRMLVMAIDAAREAGYREMYLETVPQMKDAVGLYQKLGFELLTCHKGQTGHHERCQIRMSLTLVDQPQVLSTAS